MKKIGKILIRSVSFIAVFFILLNIFSFIFTPKDGMERGSIYGVDSYKAEADNSIDIFFIGNSNIASAVAPPVIWNKTNRSSCISGKPNQSVSGAYKTVKDMYSHQSPSVVVIETDMIFAGQGRHFNKENMTALYKKVKQIVDILITNFEDAAISGMSYYYPVFKYHERWDELNAEDITNMKKRCKSQYRGYNADFNINAYDGGFNYMNQNADDSAVITKKQEKAMKKIIDLCKANGSKVILLDVPCASSWSAQRHNEMTAFAEKYSLEFIDMNTVIPEGFDWLIHTRDGGMHLNTYGAQIVSNFVGDYLAGSVDLKSDTSADKTVWTQIAQTYATEYETNAREQKI